MAHFKSIFLLSFFLVFFNLNGNAQTDNGSTASNINLMYPDEDPPYRYAEKSAEPIGGYDAIMKFIKDNIQNPVSDKSLKINGIVFVEFIIEKDGSISNAKVIVGVRPDLDAEAIRVISMMPKWKPAEHQGKIVRQFFNVPVRFTIE